MNALALTSPISTGPEFQHTATELARVYRETVIEMDRLIVALQSQSESLAVALQDGEGPCYRPFEIDFEYGGQRVSAERREIIFDKFKRQAWRILTDRLGITNLMSVKKRGEFERQLKDGDLPEITEDSILDIIMGLVDQAKDFATEASKEVFEILLRPQRSRYKTNSVFRIGRRVILSHRVEQRYSSRQFRVAYHREQEITAIDGVFHLLDGKGVMREHRGPLVQAIDASADGRGETEYFKFKCFKNGNLHLEMKRVDLVTRLNGLAAGEYVLGQDMED
jgi:hypothetical protein